MRILIIEDDIHLQESLKARLEAESFIVDAAANGKNGSYSARTNEYDLIILDLTLPDAHGFEICGEIRSRGVTAPILILSSVTETESKVRLINSGADDYLTKPFSFNELLARIRALLRRPKAVMADILKIDDLVLDSARQKVIRDKSTIYLTRKEFSLLEYLLRHQGKVVSRGMIMEHVWNADSDPFSNTIEAHILNVRKKIDAANKQKLIHTIPGRGYKIDLTK